MIPVGQTTDPVAGSSRPHGYGYGPTVRDTVDTMPMPLPMPMPMPMSMPMPIHMHMLCMVHVHVAHACWSSLPAQPMPCPTRRA